MLPANHKAPPRPLPPPPGLPRRSRPAKKPRQAHHRRRCRHRLLVPRLIQACRLSGWPSRCQRTHPRLAPCRRSHRCRLPPPTPSPPPPSAIAAASASATVRVVGRDGASAQSKGSAAEVYSPALCGASSPAGPALAACPTKEGSRSSVRAGHASLTVTAPCKVGRERGVDQGQHAASGVDTAALRQFRARLPWAVLLCTTTFVSETVPPLSSQTAARPPRAPRRAPPPPVGVAVSHACSAWKVTATPPLTSKRGWRVGRR